MKGSIMSVTGNYSIQKGDTLWAIAKRQLQVGGNEKPTNAQIVKAMNNIAQANGCETPEECREKFFNQIGAQIQVKGLEVEKTDDAKSDTVKEKTILTAGQKAQIDNIRALNYKSPELKAILDKNKNANTYAQYFESNAKFHVINTISLDDGGKVFIYADADGNIVGSVNKDADSVVKNVSIDLSDGASISLNSREDGEITSRILMSQNFKVAEDKDKTTYSKALELMLSKYDSSQVIKSANGENGENYIVDGKIVVTVIRNSEGEISQIHQFNTEVKNGEQQKYFYVDIDGDGVIDFGDGITRFDKEL